MHEIYRICTLSGNDFSTGRGGGYVPIEIRQTRFADFEALVANLSPDKQTDVVQVGAGRMSGEITQIAFRSDPLISISTGSFSRGVRTAGVMSDTRWGLGVLFAADGMANGSLPFAPGDLAFVAPGEERFTRLRGRTRFATTFIPTAVLRTFLAPSPGAYDELDRRRSSVIHHAVSSPEAFRSLLTQIAEHGMTLPNDVLAFHQRNILEFLTAPIRDASRYRGFHPPAPKLLILEIDRYLRSAGRPVHPSELCERYGISRRSLYRVFDEGMGMAPITYLRRIRLCAVHTALGRAGPGVTVRQIARAHGFLHLGRFAEQYHVLFGEQPSQTLGSIENLA
jgi:AraC family ethanolamine operon transcriptional activator